jgi:hypothetical protein
MKPMGNWVALATTVALVTGCNPGAPAFLCGGDDSKCGPGGTCEPNGLCSVPDATCPSGRRFTDVAGELSNQCVGGEQPMVDAAVDAPPDVAIDARVCFGTTFPICLAAPPTMPLTVAANMTFDTSQADTCAATTSGGDGLCVVAATTIAISAELRGIGNKPLVLIASDSITVTAGGEIDVGSHRIDGSVGAGANPAGCGAGTLPGDGSGDAAGGGAGGSFTGTGGPGGDGGPNVGTNNNGTAAAGTTNITTIRGGCPGQQGGDNGGVGGRGGGAVHLIAGNTITIGGLGINAGGAGGVGGATAESGGGGGGSGGMIGLDAPAIACTALLLANGGGGGEGADDNGDGNPGADATEEAAAAGGSGAVQLGGNGGAGSTGPAAGAGTVGDNGGVGGGTNDGGGGGGGGGAGLIKVRAGVNLGDQVSPAPTP